MLRGLDKTFNHELRLSSGVFKGGGAVTHGPAGAEKFAQF